MTFTQIVSTLATLVVSFYALHACAAANPAGWKGHKLRLAGFSMAFALVVAGSWTAVASTFGADVRGDLAGVAIAAGVALYLSSNRRGCARSGVPASTQRETFRRMQADL